MRLNFLSAILILILLPGAIFAPPLLAGKTIGPFDQMGHMIPGQAAVESDRSWDILQADGALQFYGWRDLVFEAHRTGKAPFWNPYQLAGTPLLANGQSAPYYPLHILFGKLGVPTGAAIVVLAWIHLAVAGLGTFALARRLGAGQEAAVLSGVCLAFSPFAIAWSALASVTTACCWIPVLLASQLSLIQKPSGRTALATCGAATMLLTAGHLQFIFYGLLAWAIFTPIAFYTQSDKPKPTFTVLASILALGIAGFAALPQINPTLEFSKLSHRKTVATADGYAAYQSSAIKPYEFLGLLTPAFMGQPGKPDNTETEERIPSTWIMYVKPGGNFAESAIWLGVPVVLGLAMLGRRQNWKQLSPILTVGIVGLLLAVGTPLAQLLYFGIPGFSSTGSPGRAAFLFVLGACVLAALAFPKNEDDADPTAKAIPYFGLLGVALLTILLSSQLGGLKSWIGLDIGPIIARRTTEALPILIVALLFAAGAWYAWAKRGWLSVGFIAAICSQVVAVQTNILPFSNPPKPQLETENQRVAFINQGWDFFEPPLSGVMPPNFATIMRMQDIGGYDSLMAATTVNMLKEVNAGKDPAPPTNGNMMFVKRDPDLQALAEAGVTRIYSKFAVEGLEEIDTIGDVHIYALPSSGIVPNGRITEIDTEGFRAILDEDSTSALTVGFATLPGWSVTSRTSEKSEYRSKILPGKWLTAEANPDNILAANRYDFKYVPPGFFPWPWLPAVIALFAAIVPFIKPKNQQFEQNPVELSPEPNPEE